MVDAAIIVPGIMGSQLFEGDELIWPGDVSELFLPYGKMKSLLDPDLVVGDIIGSFSLSTQYDDLVETLTQCGLSLTGKAPTLFKCPYDWRKDNIQAADRLASVVSRLFELHGDEVQISIFAHSMGGLVSRFFLESGKYDAGNCKGFDRVSRLITIGTPHRGAPLALAAALGHIKRLFLSASQVRTLANTDGFPSLYQLMPGVEEPFLWDININARLEPRSSYDPVVVSRLGLSTANLNAAVSFHKALDPARRPRDVKYFCFVGTQQETPAYVKADFAANPLIAKTVEVDGGGDGTVPSWSASIQGMQQLAVGGDHGTLYKAPEIRATIGALFGVSVLAGALDEFRISVRDEVLEPLSPLRLLIVSSRKMQTIDAQLVIRRCTDRQGSALPPVETHRRQIRYEGEELESLSLTLETPQFAGVYQVTLESNGHGVTGEGATFCVQDS